MNRKIKIMDEGERRKNKRKKVVLAKRIRVDRWAGDNALWHAAPSGAGCPKSTYKWAPFCWPLTFLSSGYDGGCCRPLLVMLVANGIYFPSFLFVKEKKKRENKRWWPSSSPFNSFFFLLLLYFRFSMPRAETKESGRLISMNDLGTIWQREYQ